MYAKVNMRIYERMSGDKSFCKKNLERKLENSSSVLQGPTDNVSGKRFFIPWTFFLGHFIPRNS